MAPAQHVGKGTKVSKDDVYATSERWLAQHGRGMVAGKGGSRQRAYFCDQHKQHKCPAVIRWTKQSTGDWKVSNLHGTRVNCAGATTSATIRGMAPVIEGIASNDSTISGPKLKKAAEGKAGGGKLGLRSFQRAKQKIASVDAAQQPYTYFAATFNDPSLTIFVDGHKGSPPALRKCMALIEVFRVSAALPEERPSDWLGPRA